MARLAGLGAAGVLATFVAAPAAMADDSSTPTDTTSDTAPSTEQATSSTPADAPSSSDPGTPSSFSGDSSAPGSTTPGSSAPGTSAPGASGGTSGGTRPHPGTAKGPVAQVVQPNYGVQKIRVQIQLDEHDTFAAGTSVANSVIQAVETGPNAPGGDPATCTTDSTGFCGFEGPDGYYVAGPGDTVTFTQLTPPDGPGVLTDVPQVVGPCVIPVIVLTSQSVAAQAEIPQCGITSEVSTTARAQGIKPTPNVIDRNQVDTSVIFVDPAAPPDAIDDSVSVHTGQHVDIPVLANDINYGLPLSITALTQPAHGHAVKIGTVVNYVSDPGYGGPDTFTYTMTTANGSDIATVHVNVIAPPIARDDSATTTAGDPGASVVIPVLANDSANGGSPLLLSFASQAAHGTIEFSGTNAIKYTPTGNYVGIDTFQYTITTPNGSDTATVTVTITAPVGVGGLANTGVEAKQLGTIAALLLVAGGWVTWSGRRNRVRRAH